MIATEPEVMSEGGVERSTRPATIRSDRLTFLDWTRGLAVVIMLQGHVFHSFTRPDLRNEGAFVISQFLGGIGPAVFLVLTGVTLAFLMNRREQQAPLARWGAALKRAGYLFLLAFLFRLQLWAFAYPQSPWTDLFKVDILNCMGFSIALMSVMAIFSTAERVRLCAGLGLAIAAASPLISLVDWSGLPPQLSAYIVPSYNYFSFFPWAAFIAFGMSFGSLLRLARPDQINRVMQWSAMGGLGLVLAGQYFSNFPYSLYPKSEFWLNSPELVLIKLGVVLILIALGFIWTEYGLGERWSWIRQFGMTSLLVYWVHIELVYGRWFGWLKETMNAYECAVAAGLVVVLMLVLSLARTRLGKLRMPDLFKTSLPMSKPSRVSGD